jgi:hypothetical protein
MTVRKIGCEMSNAGGTRTAGRLSHHLRLGVKNLGRLWKQMWHRITAKKTGIPAKIDAEMN